MYSYTILYLYIVLHDLSFTLTLLIKYRNRTVIMALLSGIGTIMWPVAKFFGGQLYDIGGYYAVYITAMCCTFLGVAYLYFVPETIMKREKSKDLDKKHLHPFYKDKFYEFILLSPIPFILVLSGHSASN